MTMVRIRFSSEDDEARGFYLLARKARVRGLPRGVYEIAKPCLALLDEHSVKYEVIPASKSNLDESQALRNPLTVEL